MLRTRTMPCLLLQAGRLVKTIRFRNPQYVGDPLNAVRIYNEKEVDDLIVLDIGAGRNGVSIDYPLLSHLAGECFMPVTYGGGIRTLNDITSVLTLGMEKVSVNAIAAEDHSFVTQAAERFGSQAIVVSIDVKRNFPGRYETRTENGRQRTGYEPAAFARQMQDAGAGEILLTSVDRDGTMDGFDLTLIKAVSEAVTVPVIACGGAGRLEHLRDAVMEGGAAAVAIGSMAVYQGPNRAVLINFPTARELSRLYQ